MRKFVVTCDRCGNTLLYDEVKDKLLDGDVFMIPVITSTGCLASNARRVELCKSCIWYLNKFIDVDDSDLV